MSAKNSFLVFSGTNTRYLAEKICASLGCPLEIWWLLDSRMENLQYRTKSQFVVAMYSWYKAHSLTLTTLWNFCS